MATSRQSDHPAYLSRAGERQGRVERMEVPITSATIRLGQLLKYAGVVEDGADARAAIEAGEVTVNGVVETRRGSQIRPGDRVRYAGEEFEVTTDDADGGTTP